MKYARYGRMRFGRCMKEDHGSVGCSADVIGHLDDLCSGRRHCQLNLPDPDLHSVLDCPKEIMPYLEASYVCVHVQTIGNQACPIFGSAPLKSTHGNLLLTLPPIHDGDDEHDGDGRGRILYQPSSPLSSSSSSSSSLVPAMAPGSPFCPWLIQARPGQRVNLTLLTFHRNVNNQKTSSSSPSTRSCYGSRLVVKDTKTSLEFDVCSRETRELHLITTQSHPVKVYLYPFLPKISSSSSSSSASLVSFMSSSSFHHRLRNQQQLLFLKRHRRDLLLDERGGDEGASRDLINERPIGMVRYVVEGCADMEVKNAHTTRDGDVMVIRCNFSSVSFRLTCHQSQWRGEALNCHKVPPTKSMHMLESTRHYTGSQNHGVLVVIGLGVAIGVAFGVFVLFAIVLCHKRKRDRSCVTTTGLFLHNDTVESNRHFFSEPHHHHHNNAIYFRNNNNNNNDGNTAGSDVMTSSDCSKSCDHLPHPHSHHPHHNHHHHHHLPHHQDPLQQNGETNFFRRQSGDANHSCDPDLYRHASMLVTLEQTPSRRRQSLTQNHPADIPRADSEELKDCDTKQADVGLPVGETNDAKFIDACESGGVFRNSTNNNNRNRNQQTGSPLFRKTAHSQLTRSLSPDSRHHPHYLSTYHPHPPHHHHHHHHDHHHHHRSQGEELTNSNSHLLLLGNESYQQYHLDDEEDAIVIGNGSVTSQQL